MGKLFEYYKISKENKMKIKLNTSLVRGLFSGTYETFWDVRDYDDGGDEYYIEYDCDEFMKTIAYAYKDYADDIKEELNSPFIKSLKFDGTYYSPREYNFKTDSLDFTIDVDYRMMVKMAKELIDNPDYEKYLHDHFSSYDGFISFTPNNGKDILEELTGKHYEFQQSVSALIRYQRHLKKMESEYGEGIEMVIYEEWAGNGYGGLDYKIVCQECDKEMVRDENFDYVCPNIKNHE